jgi:hypothetical protein
MEEHHVGTMHALALAPLAAAHMPPLTPNEVRVLTEPLTGREKRRLKDIVDIDAILADPKLSRSGRVLRVVFGSLRALGYDEAWLAGVTGLTPTEMNPSRDVRVPITHMRLALTVAARIGDRPAAPKITGLTADQIEDVRKRARREHFFVPACYDELYNYVTGVDDDGAPWGAALGLEYSADSRSATVASKVRAVAHFFAHGGTSANISREFGFAARTWQRIAQKLGIQSVREGGGPASVVYPAPGQDALRKAAFEAAAALDMGEDPSHVWSLLLADAKALAAEQAAEQATEVEQDVAA